MDYRLLEPFFTTSRIQVHDPETGTTVDLNELLPRINSLSGLGHAEMIPLIDCFRALLTLCDDEAARAKLASAVNDLDMRVAYK